MVNFKTLTRIIKLQLALKSIQYKDTLIKACTQLLEFDEEDSY